MGGYGSTRWKGVRTRKTTTAVRRLALNRHIRNAIHCVETAVRFGQAATATPLCWSTGGPAATAIAVTILGLADDAIGAQITYQVGQRPIEELLAIAFTTQQFGSYRAWWVCPRCSSRCAVLYCQQTQPGFACRQCHQLVYPSQQSSDKRAYALARSIERGHKPVVGYMDVSELKVMLAGTTIANRRLARRCRRKMGKREVRHFAETLAILESL